MDGYCWPSTHPQHPGAGAEGGGGDHDRQEGDATTTWRPAASPLPLSALLQRHLCWPPSLYARVSVTKLLLDIHTNKRELHGLSLWFWVILLKENTFFSGSSVWSQLEEALTSKEFLHHDITSVLYLRHQAALEREVMRVLELYVGVECQDWWWEDERLDISHFKPHGKLLRANPTPGEGVSRATGEGDVHKVNHWADSPLMQVSAHNNELFTRCLHLLGNVLLKTRFSFCATIACRDFLAQVCSL